MANGADNNSHRCLVRPHLHDRVPTLAVVGSFALEGTMKLSRGFRLYDDGGWLGAVGEYVFPANVVTERALHAVDQRDPSKPLFLFVHYRSPVDLLSRFRRV